MHRVARITILLYKLARERTDLYTICPGFRRGNTEFGIKRVVNSGCGCARRGLRALVTASDESGVRRDLAWGWDGAEDTEQGKKKAASCEAAFG